MMNRIEEQTRRALAAAKDFHAEHAGPGGDLLPADKREEFNRMISAVEAGAEQLTALKNLSGLEDRIGLFDDKAAEAHRLNQAALPESLRGEPSLDKRIRLAGLNRDTSFQADLQVGRAARWMSLAEQGMKKEELNLVIGTDDKGGYWTPDYWERVIATEWQKIEGVSEVVRPMITGDGNPIYIQGRAQRYAGSAAVTHATDVSTLDVAEGGAYRSDSEPTYERRTLSVYKLMEKQAVSAELLEDSLINVAEEVGSFAGQRLGEVMEQAFTNGTGVGQPFGAFAGITTVEEVDTAATGNPTVLDLHKMTTDNPRMVSGNSDRSFLINRGVWGGAIRNIGKEYLPWWGVDLTSEGRMMLFGYPVYFGTFINPSIQSNANPAGFGNWNRYLRTRIVNQMRMTVSDISESDTDEVTYRFRVRYGSVRVDDNQAVFISIL